MNEQVKEWLLLSDDVFVRQASIAVGLDGIKELIDHYTNEGKYFEGQSIVTVSRWDSS